MTSAGAGHAAGCGCCSRVARRTPAAIENRPGLGAVAYRIGAHGDFLASMRARLASADFPGLRDLLTRDPADPTLALLDAFATAADVLTFYQERIANEAFLRTSIERRSLVELARLVDHRLKPGVAAEADLAFAVDETPGAPRSLALEQGIKVQSQPGPGERPQLFETTEAVEVRVEWNGLPAETVTSHLPFSVDCFLEGVDLNLRAGDALLFVGEEVEADLSRDHWDLRMIDAVETDVSRGITHVRWRDPLGSKLYGVAPAREPQVHAFRRRAAVFGHNAPAPELIPTLGRDGDWDFKLSLEANSVDLDSVVQSLAAGSWLVLAKPNYVELFRVTAVSELSRADYALAGKVSRARLIGENYDLFAGEVRATTVFAVNEQLRFAGRPVSAPAFGAALTLAVDAAALEPGRRLALSGRRAHWRVTAAGEASRFVTLGASRRLRAGELLEVMAPPLRASGGAFVAASPHQVGTATLRWQVRDSDGATGTVDARPGELVLAAAPAGAETVTEIAAIDAGPDAVTHTPGLTRVALAAATQHCYEPASLRVNANVVRATHGEAVTQVFGSGDARRTHQRFELKSLPLTFTGANNEVGSRSTLNVRVNNIQWAERSSLFDASTTDRAYALRLGDDSTVSVQIGDGERGARLPTGRENVIATYRRGIGADGNVAAGKLSQLMTRPLGLKGVTNPAPAAGGTDPEGADSARRTIPLGVRTLGRAVSVRDYEDFARGFSGIAKAHAAVLNLRGGRTVVVTVAATAGRILVAGDPTVTRLVEALRTAGDPLMRFEVLPHRTARFRVAMRVRLDPAGRRDAIFTSIEDTLRDRFGFDARSFGQGVALSEVVAAVDGVPGVVAVDVDACYRGVKKRVDARIGAEGPRTDSIGNAVAAELLTLDPSPFDAIGEMP